MDCKLCEALKEANESLQEEFTRVRNTNAMLRKVNSTLRQRVTAQSQHADEIFTALCHPELEDRMAVEGLEFDFTELDKYLDSI